MQCQPLSTFAPVAASLFMLSNSGQRQALTYPNKPIRIITGFALGDKTNSTLTILYSKLGEEIGQSTTLESLSVNSEC
jgi:hypothetical protein